jgi:hypothetical protein
MREMLIGVAGRLDGYFDCLSFEAFRETGKCKIDFVTYGLPCEEDLPCVVVKRDSFGNISDVCKFVVPAYNIDQHVPTLDLQFDVTNPTDEYALRLDYPTEFSSVRKHLSCYIGAPRTGADLKVYLKLV